MQDVVLAVAGALLVLGVLVDALATTVSVTEGAGPLTRRTSGRVWAGLVRLHRPDSSSVVLTAAGPMLLVGTVLLWVLGLWAGWTMIMLVGDPAVVSSSTGAPATLADVVYFAGFTIFTLGVGDFAAATSTFRVLTAVASFTGLFLITLSITYLISVVRAVVASRALAVQVNALGATPGEIAAAGWDGAGFSSAYVQHLVSFTAQLATIAEQHLAYPVLHYFRSHSRDTAAAVAVAHLDDALLILQWAVAPAGGPGAAAVDPARAAVGRFVQTAGSTSSTPRGVDPPAAPDLGPLVAAGVPLGRADRFARQVEEESGRRRSLAQLVAAAGWSS